MCVVIQFDALERYYLSGSLQLQQCGLAEPQWAERARMQIYRADFVHYSTVTRGYLKTYKEIAVREWEHRFGKSTPSERTFKRADRGHDGPY
jgi:hypothetical protein